MKDCFVDSQGYVLSNSDKYAKGILNYSSML
jgi:hypothetical protein